MRAGIVGIGLGVLLAGGSLAEAFSVSYEQDMRVPQTAAVHANVWVKDELFKMEMTFNGHTTIMIRNPEGVFSYLPSEGLAMRLPTLERAQRPPEGLDDYQAYLHNLQARLVRTETIRGMLCDVYVFNDPKDGASTTVWAWREHTFFPVRFEIARPGQEGVTTIELTNIKFGPLDDSVFTLPAGVRLMDMGSLQIPDQLGQDH